MSEQNTDQQQGSSNSGSGGPVVAIIVGLAVVIVAIVLVTTLETGSVEGEGEQAAGPAAEQSGGGDGYGSAPAGSKKDADSKSGDTESNADSQETGDAAGGSGESADGDAEQSGESSGDSGSSGSAKQADASGGSNGSGGGSSQDMSQLPVEYPNPVFAGTPKEIPEDVRVDRSRLGKKRPPFVAPKGVKNVALNKPVSSSDPAPFIGTLDLATDGDKEALDGRYVELAPGKQHLTVDLKQKYQVCAILIWHNHMDPRVYRDVVVMLSNDPEFPKDQRKIVYNNDHDNTLGFGVGEDYEYFESDEGVLVANRKDQDGKTVMTEPLGTYRYVRCYSNGSTSSDLNHYTEVEVWALSPDGEPLAKADGGGK